VNASEMIKHHDYVNYYFYDKIDPIVSKPPLYLWAITIGYHIFGYNEFALRFFSALATVLFFFVFFQWVSLYKNYRIAFFSCMVLISCKAIIGYHAGRTGDMDSFLLLFTFLGLYHFSRYLDFDKKNSVLFGGIFFGLAFYSKGTAAFLLIPSLFIYILWRRKLLVILRDIRFWVAATLFVMIAGSWYLLILKFGAPFSGLGTGTTNNWKQLFIYDTLIRFTHPGIGGDPKAAHDYFYYFKTLDSRFNIWNYLLYLLSFSFVVLKFQSLKFYFKNPFYSLLFISTLTTAIILTVSQTKLDWYLTPIIPMIAILLVLLVESVSRRFPAVKFLALSLFAFILIRQFILINTNFDGRGKLFRDNKNLFQNASVAYWYQSENEQDLFTYFDWYSKKVGWLAHENLAMFTADSTAVLFGKADEHLTKYLSDHRDLKFEQRDNYYLIHH
jgi:4-amino-4-deoxy-L-arabinose transferase-like glycosyltransferase